jgi:hypothetical protein
MPRGIGTTARTILPRQLRTLVDGGSLPLRHGGAAPILKLRLLSEIFSLFLRLFLLLDQNRLLAAVQPSRLRINERLSARLIGFLVWKLQSVKSKDVAKRSDRSGDVRSLKPRVLDGREEVQAVSLAVSRRRMMVTRQYW